MPTRQTLTRPAFPSPPQAPAASGFIVAQPKPPRSRAFERANPTASYRIPPDLRDAVTELAAALHVSTSDLAAALLQHALDDYRAGRLILEPKPREGRMTL